MTRLILCRTRAHQRGIMRDDTSGARVWAMADLWDRLAWWACLRAGVTRDALGARMLAAATLAEATTRTTDPSAGDRAAGRATLPRLAPALEALRTELVHADVRAQDLADAVARAERDSPLRGADDIAQVLQLAATVEARLSEHRIVDDAQARRLALTLIERGNRPPFLAMFSRVVVHDAVDLTPLDLDVLSALATPACPVELELPVDDVAGRSAVFGVERLLRRLEAAGGNAEARLTPITGDGPLRPLRAALFGRAVVHDAPASVALAADVEEEARVAAAVVLEARATNPTARIAVAARRQQQLEPTFTALTRDGVAVRRRRRSLLESPAARLVLDLAALRGDGTPRDRLIAVLLNPARRDALHPDDAAALLTTLRRAAARRDLEDSQRPAGGYRRRLEQLARRDPSQAPRVAQALATIEPIMEMAATLPLRGRLSAHLDALVALVRRVVDDARALGGSEVFEILARLAAGARRTGDPPAPIELFALTRVVEDELARQPWLDDDVDVEDGAIEALTLPELCGRTFDVVIVVGAVEGELPAPRDADGLLGQGDRARLNAALGRRALAVRERPGAGGASGIEGQDGGVEGLWWLLGVRAARDRLVVTAPRREARGRELAPSAFLFDVARALGAGPDDLARVPVAGAPLPRGVDRRARRQRLARDGTDPALANALARATAAAADRARWYADPSAPLTDRRGPYAFAVDPRRVERAFGASFGLQASRPLTPTRLEALAECRLRGFVEHVLKLDIDVEAGNDIEARVAGTFAHTVLEDFFRARQAHGVPHDRFDAADRASLAAVIDRETARTLTTASGHHAALRAGLAFLKENLLWVTEAMIARPVVDGVEPVAFELQIGAKAVDRSPDGPAAPINVGGGRTLYLGGIIDRVDEGPGHRVVIDYKTMSAQRVKEKAHHTALFASHFQLLVYLRVMEHHRATSADTELHGYLLSLKDGVPSADIAQTPELRARVTDDAREDGLACAIGAVVLPILAGTIPPDAGDRCAECRLQRVCRVPQEGIYATDPDELAEGAP